MKYRLPVRVLHRLANLDKQLHPGAGTEPPIIAIVRDGLALGVFHHEVGSALRSRAGIEDLGDARMVHQGQRLAFGLEPRNHFATSRATFNALEGHTAAHRLQLFRKPDLPHASFSNLLDHLVTVDFGSGRKRRNRNARGCQAQADTLGDGIGDRAGHQGVVRQQHPGDDIADLRTRLQAAQVGADVFGRHLTTGLEQLPCRAPLVLVQVLGVQIFRHDSAVYAIASTSQSLANSQ